MMVYADSTERYCNHGGHLSARSWMVIIIVNAKGGLIRLIVLALLYRTFRNQFGRKS